MLQRVHAQVPTQQNWNQALEPNLYVKVHSSRKVDTAQVSITGNNEPREVRSHMEYYPPGKERGADSGHNVTM